MVTTVLAVLALIGGVVCFALALPQPLPFAAQWLNVATTLFVFAAALGIWRLVALVQDYERRARPPAQSGALYEHIKPRD